MATQARDQHSLSPFPSVINTSGISSVTRQENGVTFAVGVHHSMMHCFIHISYGLKFTIRLPQVTRLGGDVYKSNKSCFKHFLLETRVLNINLQERPDYYFGKAIQFHCCLHILPAIIHSV